MQNAAPNAAQNQNAASNEQRTATSNDPKLRILPDSERMLQWLVQTNPDSIGVLVALHAFESVLQFYNEQHKSEKPWSVVRENNNASVNFGVLNDIPNELFDFQTTFKAKVMASDSDTVDEQVSNEDGDDDTSQQFPRSFGSNETLNPKWLNRNDLGNDFWPDFKRENPDGVFRCRYYTNGMEKFFRVFWEIDCQNKNRDSNKLKMGSAIFDACEACYYVNEDIPAFTVRVNLNGCPKAMYLSKTQMCGGDNIAEDTAVYFAIFEELLTVIDHIIQEVRSRVSNTTNNDNNNTNNNNIPKTSSTLNQPYESRHYFVWMQKKNKDVGVYDAWFRDGVFKKENPVFKSIVNSITTNTIINSIDSNHEVHVMILKHATCDGQDGVDFILLNELHRRIVSNHENITGPSQNKLPYMDNGKLQNDQISENLGGLKIPSGNPTKPQYHFFDKMIYRIIEQLVVCQQNTINSLAGSFAWTGDNLQDISRLFVNLRAVLHKDRDAFLRRDMAPLDLFENGLAFRPRVSLKCKSLQRMLCESMYDDLPDLDPRMKMWIGKFNIPNAELFLRIIRCNNMLALQELARQYFSGEMQEPLAKVLRQMPVCTESEMRWLFRHVLVTVHWMRAVAQLPGGTEATAEPVAEAGPMPAPVASLRASEDAQTIDTFADLEIDAIMREMDALFASGPAMRAQSQTLADDKKLCGDVVQTEVCEGGDVDGDVEGGVGAVAVHAREDGVAGGRGGKVGGGGSGADVLHADGRGDDGVHEEWVCDAEAHVAVVEGRETADTCEE